jgi:hypothetical protein
MERINGQMGDYILVIGKIIKCMVLVNILGLTGKSIMENILMTKSKVMEY